MKHFQFTIFLLNISCRIIFYFVCSVLSAILLYLITVWWSSKLNQISFFYNFVIFIVFLLCCLKSLFVIQFRQQLITLMESWLRWRPGRGFLSHVCTMRSVHDARSHAFIALALNHLGCNFDSHIQQQQQTPISNRIYKNHLSRYSLYYNNAHCICRCRPLKTKVKLFFCNQISYI